MILHSLQVLSALAFIFYGCACLFSNQMHQEFQRFGLAKYRLLTGILEVTAGLGLLLGFFSPPLFLISSGGLSLLMLLGVGVRWRVGDSWMQAAPAASLLVINLILFLSAL